MKRCILLGVLALVAVPLLAAPLWGDKWPIPTPRVFGSQRGGHAFKVLKPEFGGVSEGVLFHLDGEGKEQIVWQVRLVNTPHQAVVDEKGRFVATIDTYGNLGFAHSLVIYGEQGQVICDFQLEDLLSKEEIETKLLHSEYSRCWAEHADFEFQDDHLAIRLHWGKSLRVELASGKLSPTSPQKQPEKQSDTRVAGLIGTAQKNGEPTGIAYHYPHGKIFPPALIRDQFHDGELNRPSVRIELIGYVDVPEETKLDIYHAAGGVNLDHGTLFIDGRQLGQVGDDTAKSVIYTLTLPKGTHEVRWVLTGGTFQANLLKIQNAKSGELLTLFHTQKQRDETGASKAVKTIDAQGEVEGWPPGFDPKAWTRVSTD
jgi:hypothetical protein